MSYHVNNNTFKKYNLYKNKSVKCFTSHALCQTNNKILIVLFFYPIISMYFVYSPEVSLENLRHQLLRGHSQGGFYQNKSVPIWSL